MGKCKHRTEEEAAYDLFVHGTPRCRHCRQESSRKHYRIHKKIVLLKAAEYRHKNPEKIKQMREAYKIKIKNLTLMPKVKISRNDLKYANKLKNIIIDAGRVQRRYRKFIAAS